MSDDNTETSIQRLLMLASATSGADMVLVVVRMFTQVIAQAEAMGLPDNIIVGLVKAGMSDVYETNHEHWLETLAENGPELHGYVINIGPDYCVGDEWRYSELAEVATMEYLLNR